MIYPESVPDLPGVPVLDVDGDIIGSVERVYVHENTGAPLWVSIHMGFDVTPSAFAPLDGARFDDQPGSALHVGLPKAVLDDAPSITSVDTLTRDDVHTLRAYYSALPAATAAAPSQDGSGMSTVDVVRSEEQLRVITVPVPKERVRFEKVIVTEEKNVTVTVRREELHIIREPVEANTDMATTGGQTSATDLDIVLHEERIITTTEIVPIERVRVHVTEVTEDLPVTDTVRKERVDLSTSTS